MNRLLFRTRIKFCGMARPGDVRLAGELGADAIGFVFAAGSPRQVTAQQARLMRSALAPLVDAVAVFQDNPLEDVRAVVKQVRPSLLQFHGSEDDAFCRAFGAPYIKAIPMGRAAQDSHTAGGSTALQARYPEAAGFLFDSHDLSESGGSGASFDWRTMPRDVNKPVLLAGGLNPENVFDAILATLPWGVDVSSGIESSPGIKDGERMRRFVEEVRRADCHVEHDTAG